MEHLRQRRDDANIEATQTKQKKQYDIKPSKPFFNVGDVVYRCNRRRDTLKDNELGSRYDGLYVIAEAVGKGVYRLTTKEGEPIKSPSKCA